MIAGGLVYFLSNDMNLYAAVADTGQLKWWTRVGSASRASSPVLGDNLIYLSTGGMMQAFQTQTGYQKWAFTLPGNITSVPVYANGILYFACSDHNLYAITREGRAKWKAPVDMKVSAFGTPVIAGDTVIIGGGKGMIMAVDTETGKVKWNYTVMPSYLDIGKYEYVNMTSPMVVYKDTLYSFSDDGTLFAFRSDVVDNTPPQVTTVLPYRDSLVPGTGTLTIGGIVSDEGSGINWETASFIIGRKAC